VPELLPGNSVTLQATFSGVPATVLLATKITLTPLAAKDAAFPEAAAERTRTGRTLAIPWSVLVLLLVVGLLAYARKAYRRHRDEDAAAAPASSTGPDVALAP